MWLEDLSSVLVTGGVATKVYLGRKAEIPVGDGPYVSLISYGGAPGDRTHDTAPGFAYTHPGAQCIVRCKSLRQAFVIARLALVAFNNVRDVVINDTYYLQIRPVQSEPFEGEEDGEQRPIAKFNVIGFKRPEGVH